MTDIYDHIGYHRVTDYAICEAHIVNTVKDLLSKEEQDRIIVREEEVEGYVGSADQLKEEEMDPPPSNCSEDHHPWRGGPFKYAQCPDEDTYTELLLLFGDGNPNTPEQNLSLAQKLRKHIMGMVKIRRSPTMDLGAATHVMPIGGPFQLTVMKSLGSLS